jgi:hypothetical protein
MKIRPPYGQQKERIFHENYLQFDVIESMFIEFRTHPDWSITNKNPVGTTTTIHANLQTINSLSFRMYR